MPIPMLIVLDEAANIVRWRDLPKQYSHFGSRGIVVMTILQSWAQGVRCWGAEGMDALWSAANIKVLGSGLDDAGFLRDRSRDRRRPQRAGHQRSRRSPAAGLGDHLDLPHHRDHPHRQRYRPPCPRGRCLVFTSGHRPMLVRTVPWMERGDADLIRASLAEHTPTTTPAAPRLRAVPSDEEDAA